MYMRRQKIKFSIKILIIVLLSIMLAGTVFNIIYITKSHDKFKPKGYYTTIALEEIQPLEKWEYKALINELFNTPHIYIENNIKKQNVDGFAIPFIRVIVVEPNLSNVDYAYALAHEFVHVKYQTGNETWTSYKAFVELYESGSSALKYVALRYAVRQLQGCYADTEYDCSYYIFEYLQGQGIV